MIPLGYAESPLKGGMSEGQGGRFYAIAEWKNKSLVKLITGYSKM